MKRITLAAAVTLPLLLATANTALAAKIIGDG